MVHTPSAYTYNFWTKTPTEVVELTCLMPNGVLIPLETNRNTTLAEIKEVNILLKFLVNSRFYLILSFVLFFKKCQLINTITNLLLFSKQISFVNKTKTK